MVGNYKGFIFFNLLGELEKGFFCLGEKGGILLVGS